MDRKRYGHLNRYDWCLLESKRRVFISFCKDMLINTLNQSNYEQATSGINNIVSDLITTNVSIEESIAIIDQYIKEYTKTSEKVISDTPLPYLSAEIWVHIFEYLPFLDGQNSLMKKKVYLVCRQFYFIIRDTPSFWMEECFKIGIFAKTNKDRINIEWSEEVIKWYLGEREQRLAIELVVDKGLNVFITGGAGVGKSFIIKEIIKKLKEKKKNVAVTASTGIASLQIGGVTIHSWAGIGLGRLPVEVLLKNVHNSHMYDLRYKWKSTNVLIIDEISLLSIEYFEKLDIIAKNLRGNQNLPFGGMQLVFVGDFYQLPPIEKDKKGRLFCFESEIWEDTIHQKIHLNQVRRQTDKIFIEVLNRIRRGIITEKDKEILGGRVNKPLSLPLGIKPTRLFPKREDAEKWNQEELKKLDTESHTFFPETGSDIRDPDKKQIAITSLMNSYNIQDKITLKVRTQVIVLRNINREEEIMNGSRGVVVRFEQIQEFKTVISYPVILFTNGTEKLIKKTKVNYRNESTNKNTWVIDLFLGYGWATSIHKSQGMTLDAAEIDLGSNVFAAGMSYVAMSRVRSLAALNLLSFNPNKIKANKSVIEYYNKHIFKNELS